MSAYELEREARIAANNKLLKSLGIDQTRDALAKACASPKKRGQSAGSAKPKVKAEDLGEGFVRRSTRNRGDALFKLEALPDDWREGAEASEEEGPPAKRSKRPAKPQPPKDRPPPDPSSSRSINAKLSPLAGILGERVPGGHVKAGVMGFLNGGSVPKFSKYVGVQEWSNCVLLMFNLGVVADKKGGSAASTYTNSFTLLPSGAMHVNYYLSERTQLEAPIVKRLEKSKVGGFDEAGGSGGASVHLFVRPDDAAVKSGAIAEKDYVYVGRLKYVGHDTSGDVPVEFVFEMADFEAMRDKEGFKSLMKLAKITL